MSPEELKKEFEEYATQRSFVIEWDKSGFYNNAYTEGAYLAFIAGFELYEKMNFSD